MSTKQTVTITCADGFELAGTLYAPQTLKAAIMIGPATGIKQTFYYSLAIHLAAHGYGILCYDNRGIGQSLRGPLRQEKANLITWGQQDMTAALKALQAHFPDTTYHLLGHSAGGQLIGLMENALELASIFNVACSSGSIRNLAYPFRLKALFLMNVFLPVNNLVFGYSNSQWVGMGEPLPRGVAQQWREWCNGSGYVAMDFGKGVQQHHYDELKVPTKWLFATDDEIANLANVKDMIRVFPQLAVEMLTLDPKAWGYPDIGHMKFFSSKRKELWQIALDWFDQHA